MALSLDPEYYKNGLENITNEESLTECDVKHDLIHPAFSEQVTEYLITKIFEKEDSVVIYPNKYLGFFIYLDKYILNYFKRAYLIVTNTINYDNYYVCDGLIDFDYPGRPYFYVFNHSSQKLNLKMIQFKLQVVYSKVYLFPNYSLNIFRQDKFYHNYEYDRIIAFKKASFFANGIDIIFLNDYSIQGKGYLQIQLQLSENRVFDFYPNFYMLRSRFSKMGVCINIIPNKRFRYILFLTNNSDKEIFLGKSFIQIKFPPPFSFMINEALLLSLCNGTTIDIRNLPRKLKNPQDFVYENKNIN
jgi:hypothetical protein